MNITCRLFSISVIMWLYITSAGLPPVYEGVCMHEIEPLPLIRNSCLSLGLTSCMQSNYNAHIHRETVQSHIDWEHKHCTVMHPNEINKLTGHLVSVGNIWHLESGSRSKTTLMAYICQTPVVENMPAGMENFGLTVAASHRLVHKHSQ